jgi:chaperonin GroES
MEKLQPLNARVLIRPEMRENNKVGNLYLPESALEPPHQGVIVEMAISGVSEVSVGDRVIYQKGSGEEVKLEQQTYILVEASDLLAKYADLDEIPK